MVAEKPKKFIVYKSSAGSGKTYTLVRVYLKLVLKHPERYSNILAVTFTNKAANEMKSRILKTLRALSEPMEMQNDLKIKQLSDEFSEQLGLSAKQISENSRKALTLILHNYSNFAVSTIDSFVHRLVKTFAKDLGLPVSFEVEMEEKKLIDKSVDLLISKVGTDPELTNVMVRFVESKMNDDKSWDIGRQLADFSHNILKENSFEALKNVRKLKMKEFIEMVKKLNEIRYQFENSLHQPAKEAVDLIEKNSLELNDFYYGKTGIAGYLKRISDKDFSAVIPGAHALKSINENIWYSPKCPSDISAAIDLISDKVAEKCKQIVSIKEKGYQEYVLSKLVLKNIYLMAVLSEIEKVMEEFRQNENIVHISEFNKRIADIVQNEPVPFIYERIGEKYKHFLIDEFQDTSLLQWQNMIPLIENSLSTGNLNMIVGDGKQAIYRWRNGEVEQFAALPDIYNRKDDPVSIAREQIFRMHYQPEDLDRNYRSSVEIVKFNNNFFTYASGYLSNDFKSVYNNLNQKHQEHKTGGYIQIEFLNEDDLSKTEFMQLSLECVLEIVRNNLNSYRPEQIAVLTRTNFQGSSIAAYLLQNGISVVSSEALLLRASDEVRFMISIMKYMLSPDDRVSLAEVLTFLWLRQKIKIASLHEVLTKCSGSNPLNKESVAFEQMLTDNGINFSMQMNLLESLPEFFESMIRIFNLDPEGRDPFLQFFLDMIYEFSSGNGNAVNDFLTYWEETGSTKSIIVPEDTPSVRVMTIHKAKGLQFPVVVYPFAYDKNDLTVKEVWIDPDFKSIPELNTVFIDLQKEMEGTSLEHIYRHESEKSFLDMLNLLYVVMTRPEERLYVISKEKKDKNGQWKIPKNNPDIADLLFTFLEKGNIIKDEKGKYCIGNEIFAGRSRNEEKPNIITEFSQLNTGQWRRKIALKHHYHDVWSPDAAQVKRDTGLLVHYALSLIICRKDMERVCETLMEDGLLTEDKLPELKALLGQLMSREEISSYYDEGNQVFNEKEILMKDGTILRPDRVVISGQKAVVIDYKTGQESYLHKLQLQSYADALKEMGYQEVEQHLVYLDKSETTKFS
ncbi:MAG: hypothetical protein EOM06_08395 [Sphingobacteriia bacterium]|nr:hypothetical protein [Sphingobacteriia bacterium]